MKAFFELNKSKTISGKVVINATIKIFSKDDCELREAVNGIKADGADSAISLVGPTQQASFSCYTADQVKEIQQAIIPFATGLQTGNRIELKLNK